MSAPRYDIVVLGGGISGAGILRDAAMRGLDALLVEKGRPSHGTTVNSSWLIHGGLRYLYYDRYTTHLTSWDSGHIVRMARPLLNRLPIVWPVYREHRHGLENVEALLESYDRFQAMKLGKPHLRLRPKEVLRLFPGIRSEGLVGAVAFDEWWVDPEKLVLENLASAERHGANYHAETAVRNYDLEGGRLRSIEIERPGSAPERIFSSTFVNATGPWVGDVAAALGLNISMRLRRGIHLLYRRRLFNAGLLLEAADRKRYVFVLPMGSEKTLVGPTDVPCSESPDALTASEDETGYLRQSLRRYFPSFESPHDETPVGARPILGGQDVDESLLSREYEVFDHREEGVDGFITLAGGKMSSYRVMAEDVVDLVCRRLGKEMPCRTHLETLAGESIEGIPEIVFPSPAARRFMQRHPYIRKGHAMAHLGLQALRHWAGRLGGRPPSNPFEKHFEIT